MLPSDPPQKLVIPKRGCSREESAVSPPAASRFLAGKPGFGMTSVDLSSIELRDDAI